MTAVAASFCAVHRPVSRVVIFTERDRRGFAWPVGVLVAALFCAVRRPVSRVVIFTEREQPALGGGERS